MFERDSRSEDPSAAAFAFLCRYLTRRNRLILKSYMLLKLRRVESNPINFPVTRQWKFRGYAHWREPLVIGGEW